MRGDLYTGVPREFREEWLRKNNVIGYEEQEPRMRDNPGPPYTEAEIREFYDSWKRMEAERGGAGIIWGRMEERLLATVLELQRTLDRARTLTRVRRTP